MSGQILTIAGAMFMIPVLTMVAFALVTDVPDRCYSSEDGPWRSA